MKMIFKLENLIVVLTIFFLTIESGVVSAAQNDLSVRERNALMGLNDTIDRLAPDFVTVSLCIAEPTDQSQDYLGITGHAFLRMQCSIFGMDYCFSYESEQIKGQILDYLQGKLKMGMHVLPTDEYLEDYHEWKRAVHEYRINMSPEAEIRFWELMDNHVSSGEMQLDIVKFGCSNTVLRYVERALLPDTISYNWPEKFYSQDIMEIVSEHFVNYPWTLLGVRLTAGEQLRRLKTPKQKVIFPNDLLLVWSAATIDGNPLLTYMGDLVEAEPMVVHKPWFTPQLCGILLLILLVVGTCTVFVRKKQTNS